MSQAVADLTAHKKSFDNGYQVAWDATSIALLETCPRKYYWQLIQGLRSTHKSVHLIFGGLYASALEQFYKLRATGLTIEEALRQTVRTALESSWDQENDRPIAFEDTNKTRLNLIRTIVWYIDQFAKETDDGITTYHLQSGAPAVELSFTIEAENNLLLCGHLDRVVNYADALYVMDQKTSGTTIGTYYFNNFSPNTQMSLYTWCGQSVLHTPIRGVIIDAAQIAVNFTRFERGITTRSKKQLSEWYEETMLFLDLSRRYNELDKWPMNPSACGYYNGCEFRVLCSKSPGVRDSYIKTEFTSHNWDPVEAR